MKDPVLAIDAAEWERVRAAFPKEWVGKLTYEKPTWKQSWRSWRDTDYYGTGAGPYHYESDFYENGQYLSDKQEGKKKVPMVMGSMTIWGRDAWPPRPVMVMMKLSSLAMSGPLRVSRCPAGQPGML